MIQLGGGLYTEDRARLGRPRLFFACQKREAVTTLGYKAMKTTSAMKGSIAMVLLAGGPVRAEDPVAVSLTVFAGKFAKVGQHFERAKMETTWSGFYLRGDSQSKFKESDWQPSPEGFWLGVRILPAEDLKTATSPAEPPEGYVEKIVGLEFPKEVDADSGLLISLRYGAGCDPKVVAELVEGIEAMRKKAVESGVVQAVPAAGVKRDGKAEAELEKEASPR